MLKIVEDINEANYITHSGTMHADELFATAFLELYLNDIKLKRVPNINPDEHKDKLIYDIGRKSFDHHQEDALKRENGITYSSFGLLWKRFGLTFLEEQKVNNPEEVFDEIDKDLVEQIDAIDNGTFPKIEADYRVKTLSDVFKLFNPSFNSSEKEKEQFIKAEYFAKEILKEEILSISGKVFARNKVIEYIKNNENENFLILDEFMPYEETLQKEDVDKKLKFVIFPSNRGGYAIKTLFNSFEDKTNRVNFPKEWAGLMDEELESVSGIDGLIFCHNKLFICTCKDLDSAIKTAKKAIEVNNVNE